MDTPLFEPTVFLVDDDDAVRSSLHMLISTYGLQVQSLPSAEAFLEAWRDDTIGCLVLDIRMGGISGLTLQQLLQERGISIPIVFITGHGDVSACRRAFQGGAVDFLIKPVDEQALIQSIRKGISQAIATQRTQNDVDDLRGKLAQLSDREKEVLALMLEGLPNKLIARQIDLSTRTVESHRARIFIKLEADSLAQLVRRVVKLELDEASLQR
ncbi:MAG: response regulator [Pedobacter sp.]|nr:response regulator [Pedobacter sp.]